MRYENRGKTRAMGAGGALSDSEIVRSEGVPVVCEFLFEGKVICNLFASTVGGILRRIALSLAVIFGLGLAACGTEDAVSSSQGTIAVPEST